MRDSRPGIPIQMIITPKVTASKFSKLNVAARYKITIGKRDISYDLMGKIPCVFILDGPR